MTTTAVDLDNRVVAVAVRLGTFAARLGRDIASCPYRGDETPQVAVLRRVWLSAYLRERGTPDGVKAAAKNPPDDQTDDAADDQAEWEAAVAALLAGWPFLAAALIDSLATQAATAALATGTGLGALVPPQAAVQAIAAALAEAMAALAEPLSDRLTAAAGGTEPARPDPDTVARYATATAGLIAAVYAAIAGRRALLVPASAVAATVRAALTELTAAASGTVVDYIRAALTAAQNMARVAVYTIYPPTRLVADETLDRSTCKPCSDIAGTVFPTLAAALDRYPVVGYRECKGGWRCRGFVRAEWSTPVRVAAAAGHPNSCERATLGSLCDCECAGVRHAVIAGGGVPSAGRVTDRVRRPQTGTTTTTRTEPARTEPAAPTRTAASEADWARWRENMARPGVRETVTTRREQRGADFRQELAEAEANLTAARERAAEALGKRRRSRAERERKIDEATRQEQFDVTMARNQVEHVETSTDPVWDEAARTERSGAQEVDEANPLAVYGDLLHSADESDVSAGHLRDIEQVPAHFHGAVRDYVVDRPYGDPGGIFIGDQAVPELDDLGRLRGEQPRGWSPGSTFDQVPGVFSPVGRVVAMGGGGHDHGSGSLGRHELGHGLDEALGEQLPGVGRMSIRPDFTNLHAEYAQAPGQRNPYYVQRTDQGQLADGGRSEMWAESFSVWSGNRTGNPTAALSRHFDTSPELAQRLDRYFADLDRQIRAQTAARRARWRSRSQSGNGPSAP